MKKRLLLLILTAYALALMYTPVYAQKDILNVVSGKTGTNMISLYNSLGYNILSDGTIATYEITDTNSDAGQPNVGVNSKKDSNKGNLTSGNMQAKNGHMSNQSSWYGCNVTGVFDLGSIKTIDRIDLWWYQAIGSVQNTNLKVRVSKDNVTWTNLSTTVTRTKVTDISASLDYDMAMHTFASTDARFFEVTLVSSGQIYFDEVVAFGGKTTISSPSKNITVISGNVKRQSEIERYRDLGYEIKWDDSAEKFSYSHVDLGISGNPDYDTDELNDGITQTTSAYWGVWNSDAAIKIDLGEKKVFDRVDVWSHNGGRKANSVIISVSDNGTDWRVVGTTGVEPSSEDESPLMELIPVQFTPQEARFVKVHVGKKYYQLILSEIYVINSKPGVLGMGVTVSGDKVNSINKDTESGRVLATGEITIGGFMLAAHYKYTEDGLPYLHNVKTSVKALGKNTINMGKTETFENGDMIKLFAFDGMETLKSIENTMEIPVGNMGESELLSADATHKAVTTGLWRNEEFDISPLFNGVTLGENAFAENSEYTNVETTLSETSDIDYIDVYGSGIDKVSVYASMNGYNFDLIETQTQGDDKIRVEIPGVCYANKVRVLVASENGNPGLSEIEIYGKPAKYEKIRKTKYRYDDEVPFVTSQDVLDWDEDKDILSDGDTDEEIECYDEHLSIIYDLGGFCQVEDITVYGYHGGVELLTSPDGMSYYTAGFFPCVDDITTIWGRCEHNAKFVKLVFRGDGGDGIFLSEIELNARKLSDWADENEVPVRATVKPNNIVMLDWSDYRADLSGDFAYNVYIEKEEFNNVEGLTPKKVFVEHSTLPVQSVKGYYCTYAGLEPEEDYYIAVLPENIADTSVTPIKITSNPALGGGSIAGIFCVNEYNGGAYIQNREEIEAFLASGTKLWPADNITQAEIDAVPMDGNSTQKVRKLLADMEVISKNRHFSSPDSTMINYFPRGISWFASNMPTTQNEADRYNGWGVYTFGHTNEPEITAEYKNDANKFGREFSQIIKSKYETLKSISPKSLLYSPTLCGTDWLDRLGKLYEYAPDLSDYYDVCDVHTYSKTCDPAEETIYGAETKTVPEKLLIKHERISDIIESYGEAKEIVATEMGWPTCNTPSVMGNSDEQMQANFITRMYLCGIMAGMKEIYLYAFQNEGYLSNEEVAAGKTYLARLSKEKDANGQPVYYIARSAPSQEHVAGVVDWYGNPKPAYFAYYTLGKVLKDCIFIEQIEDFGDLNYGGVFYDEVKNKYVTALWNISGDGSSVEIESDEEDLLCVGMYGETYYITPGDVEIGSSPIYIYSDLPIEVFEN